MQTDARDHPRPAPALATRAMTVMLLVLLALGLVHAARWTLAEILVSTVRSGIAAWDEAEPAPDLSTWTATKDRLATAMDLKPADAEHYRLLGLMHEWRFLLADNLPSTEAEISGFRQQAIDAYRQSALLRPAWPAGWGNLARQKAMLGQEDPEMLQALQLALELGPNEAEVRRQVTDVVTLSWPFLQDKPVIRDMVLASIERSLMPPQDDETLQHLYFIIDRNMQTELCPLLPGEKLGSWAQEACAVPVEPPQESSQ